MKKKKQDKKITLLFNIQYFIKMLIFSEKEKVKLFSDIIILYFSEIDELILYSLKKIILILLKMGNILHKHQAMK